MEITYINSRGTGITLNHQKPFFASKIDGTGAVRQSINTSKLPNQNGEFYVSSSVDMRNITLEGSIVADNMNDAHAKGTAFLRGFYPREQGMLIYRGKRIPCVVEEAEFIQSSVNRVFGFFVSLLCPAPFFESIEEIRKDIVQWKDTFLFPFEIILPGVEFGVRDKTRTNILIDNQGDVETGFRAVLKFTETIEKPSITNDSTGEKIVLQSNFSAGSELHIHTHFADKKVILRAGEKEYNMIGVLSSDSTFFSLQTGGNLIRYDAAANKDSMWVTIYYRPRFLGV